MSKLESHPLPPGADDEDDEGSEVHKGDGIEIKVTQKPGFLCHIRATANFNLSADRLFRQVICHPDNANIFRHMDRCSYRKILEDDGNGKQKVEVAHEASWRFLVFRGSFTTHLVVEQDMGQHLMTFRLKEGSKGIMKKFVGSWQLRQDPHNPAACVVHLDQDIALGVFLPPPFGGILKGISCSQVRKIMEDVQTEAKKINKGKPSLLPWEEVQLTEIGVTVEEPAAAATAAAASAAAAAAAAEEPAAEVEGTAVGRKR